MLRRKKRYLQRQAGFFLLFIILIYLGTTYELTTKLYNQELDIISYWPDWPRPQKPDSVKIYSGEPGGNYYKIAYTITRNDSSKYFRMAKPGSIGGYENPNRVMLDPHGMGFVQEDIYRDGDKMKEQIEYVVPLYMEKLHILYNKKSPYFQSLLKENPDRYLSLGFNDTALISAIKLSRIAVGKAGTSTKLLSSIVLSDICHPDGGASSAVGAIGNESLTAALSKIKLESTNPNAYDILFFMAGQPVDEIRKLLCDSSSFGLIGMEPSFVDAINRHHQTNYRNTDFSVKKIDSQSTALNKRTTDLINLSYGVRYENLPTLGSNNFLIANKSVEPYLITLFVDSLDQAKNRLGIDFYPFRDNYKYLDEVKKSRIRASLILTLTAGVTLGAIILSFIFALISSYHHDKFNNDLAAVIKDIPDERIPDDEKKQGNKNFDKESFKKFLEKMSFPDKEVKMKAFELYYNEYEDEHIMKRPYIQFYQLDLINNNIVSGMSALVDLRIKINQGLNDGLMNTEHFNDLLGRTDAIMEKLRKSLFLRLHEIFNRPERFDPLDKNDSLIKSLLLKYVTSSYLNFDDYKKLVK